MRSEILLTQCEIWLRHVKSAYRRVIVGDCEDVGTQSVPLFMPKVYKMRCRNNKQNKSHIVYRLCNHMVYTLSLIQPGVIVQEIALFECVNSLVQVDAADSELSEHQCDLPRERRLANGDAFPTKPFA